MSDFGDVDQDLTLIGGEELMEQEDLDILNKSRETAEQDLSQVDEGADVMEVTPGDPQVQT